MVKAGEEPGNEHMLCVESIPQFSVLLWCTQLFLFPAIGGMCEELRPEVPPGTGKVPFPQ